MGIPVESVIKCLKKIDEGQFDEFHIKSLLIDVRSVLPKGSCLLEIGDIIDHPKKDRGINLDNINGIISGITAHVETGSSVEIRQTFTGEEIVEELAEVLTEHIDSIQVGNVLMNRKNDIILCFLVLLQNAVIIVNDFEVKTRIFAGPDNELWWQSIIPTELFKSEGVPKGNFICTALMTTSIIDKKSAEIIFGENEKAPLFDLERSEGAVKLVAVKAD